MSQYEALYITIGNIGRGVKMNKSVGYFFFCLLAVVLLCPLANAIMVGSCADGTQYGKCSTINPGSYCTGSISAPNLQVYVAMCPCEAVSGWVQQGVGDSATCVQAACADGTMSGSCSSTRPKMCVAGNLVDNATACGCEPGSVISGNSCTSAFCADGTGYGGCSINNPGYYCNGTPPVLENMLSLCPCSNYPGSVQQGTGNNATCVQATCADGTVTGQCSPTKPKMCVDGVLVDNATHCGCPTGTFKQGELCITQTVETISSCGTLVTANIIYTLNQSVNATGTCFSITAENVTIDCADYSITGNNVTTTYGIYSDQFNTTIKNCRIKNFQHGIYFDTADNGTIANVVSSPTNDGIHLTSSFYNTITNSLATSNWGRGIVLESSSYNTIINSTGTSNYDMGIVLFSSSNNNLFTNTTGTSTSGYGILISSSSNNNIVNSIGTSSSWIGIQLNSAFNNTISNSQILGLGVYGALSIYSGAQSNTIINNTIDGNGGTYATVFSPGANTGNTLINNTFINAINLLYLDSGSSGNNICLNNFTYTNGLYVNDTNGANLYNCTYDGKNQGNVWYNVIDGNVQITGILNSSISGLYIGSAGTGYPYSNITSGGKVIGVTDYAPLTLTYPPPCTCGVLSTPNSVCTLTSNQSVNGSTCFTVSAANVTIDCASHSITGYHHPETGMGSDFGIYSNQNYTIVKNCIIGNYSAGINFFSNTNSVITNNTAYNNYAGIHFSGTFQNTNNIITNNTAHNNNHGIFLSGSNNNTLIGNTANNNAQAGIFLAGSSNTVLTGNTIYNNYDGIFLNFNSENNTVTSNSLNGNNGSGISLYMDSRHNVFVNNTLLSANQKHVTIYANTNSSGNLFYWNNFTDIDELYINDSNGGNFYNTTINGKPEGNIYTNVMNGGVQITGNSLSSYGNGLYIGEWGSHPYNNTNSQGKVTTDVVDFAPLTPYQNSPPRIMAITIVPNFPPVYSTLYCSITAGDAEQSNLTLNYTWYRNGIAYLNGATLVNVNPSAPPPCMFVSITLNASITQAGDNWSCSAFASDGTLSSPTNSSVNVTIVAPMQLTIYKHVINDNGGTKKASDFNMTFSQGCSCQPICGGAGGGGSCGCGGGGPSHPFSENGNVFNLYANGVNDNYSVDEIADFGYAKSIGANCSGTVVNGENRTCIITNDDMAVLGNASSMNASGFSSTGVSINGTEAFNSSTLSGALPVVISDNGTQLLNFSYNFSTAMLNFSGITITKGTGSNGAAYVTVAGINSSAIVGTKTVYIYNASNAFNYVCVKDAEGIVGVGQISGACDGTSETLVPCTGVNTNGFACVLSGTTLTITGLVHSGVEQHVAPPGPVTTTSSSSSNGGGGGGGGGSSSAASTRSTTDVTVDVGGTQCIVTIERVMESSNTSSVLTTTLTNTGGSECNMANYVFTDTIPSSFASMSEISFSTEYTSASGASVTYNFPSFAGGESKTLSYSVARWASPRRASDFVTYKMSASKPASTSAPQPAQQPIVPAVTNPVVTQPVKKTVVAPVPVIPNAAAPKTNENFLAGALFDSDGSISLGAISALAIASFVALAGVVFIVWRKIRRN